MLIDRGDAFGHAQVSWSRAEGMKNCQIASSNFPTYPMTFMWPNDRSAGAVGGAIGDERLGRDVP